MGDYLAHIGGLLISPPAEVKNASIADPVAVSPFTGFSDDTSRIEAVAGEQRRLAAAAPNPPPAAAGVRRSDSGEFSDFSALSAAPMSPRGQSRQKVFSDLGNFAEKAGADRRAGKVPLAETTDDGYHLEAIDPKRSKGAPTMGVYLASAWETYRNETAPDKGFWEWVDEKISTDPAKAAREWNADLFRALDATPALIPQHVQWFKEGVKYIAEGEARDRYKVTEKDGRLYFKLRREDAESEPFDSKELWDRRRQKGPPESGPVPVGNAIWAMHGKQFYTNISKVGRFHHSSFTAGGAVEAAGEWEVEQGKVKWISGQSGHYKPDIDALVKAVRALPKSVITEETEVRLFQLQNEARLKVKDFLDMADKDKLRGYFPVKTGLSTAAAGLSFFPAAASTK